MKSFRNRQYKYLFLGMPSHFSYQVLKALLLAGETPSAVWLPEHDGSGPRPSIRLLPPEQSRSPLPLVDPFMQPGIAYLAWQYNIPVYGVSDLSAADSGDYLVASAVDIGIIACFPKILPPAILTALPYGFLNLHPSLLPAYRGPYPLFWTLRDGIRHTGITLHHVDKGVDSGDIVLQADVTLPDGIGPSAADKLFARLGTELVLDAFAKLANGELPRRQQKSRASYYGSPQTEDFTIPTTWTARRAFNFMRGTADWRMPYRISGPGFEIAAHSALRFEEVGRQQIPLIKLGDTSTIKFTEGILQVKNR